MLKEKRLGVAGNWRSRREQNDSDTRSVATRFRAFSFARKGEMPMRKAVGVFAEVAPAVVWESLVKTAKVFEQVGDDPGLLVVGLVAVAGASVAGSGMTLLKGWTES